jgi:hypothetical protein
LPLDLVDAAHLAREGFAAGELVKFRLPAHRMLRPSRSCLLQMKLHCAI